jgi:hypothetical protein
MTVLRRYVLRSDRVRGLEGWAIFVIGDDGYFSACSDYGNYAFLWRSVEGDFRRFLTGAKEDPGYFIRKFGTEVYDGTLAVREIKDLILAWRREARGASAGVVAVAREEARREWNLLKEHETEIGDSEAGLALWAVETEMEGWYHDVNTKSYPWDVRNFVEKSMARLADILQAELDAEAQVGASP